MTKRHEIENYLLDFEVLHAFASAKGVVIERADYDAIVADPIGQDFKLGDTIERLKRLCETRGPHDSFKRGLAKFIPDTSVFIELESVIF
jgi:hypothetical protein